MKKSRVLPLLGARRKSSTALVSPKSREANDTSSTPTSRWVSQWACDTLSKGIHCTQCTAIHWLGVLNIPRLLCWGFVFLPREKVQAGVQIITAKLRPTTPASHHHHQLQPSTTTINHTSAQRFPMNISTYLHNVSYVHNNTDMQRRGRRCQCRIRSTRS